jgi:hypothetical protein
MASSPARNQATDRQLDASEKAKRAMEKGYELGVVTIVDLLNAQKQLSEAHKIQRQARYRYFKARSSLLQQVGRLDVEELAKLNDWIAEPVVNAVAEPVTKPVVNAIAKPVTKPVVNAIAKPVTKPVVNAVAKPATNPVVNAVAKPATNPVVNAVAEPVIKPTVNLPKTDSDCGGVHIDYRNPKYKHCLVFTPPATH